ncbi:MAG: outer membrane protein assembly factor, partial [Burkholderiales bacterium]
QGYLNAQVAITSWPAPALPDYVQVKIKVNKGEKFIINKILIQGNDHIHADVLKAHLQYIQEKPRFTLVKDILGQVFTLQPIRKGGVLRKQPTIEGAFVYLKKHVIPFSSKFVKSNYEKDKKNLINYYQSQGYRDAVIVADSVYKQSEGLLNISWKVAEGQQYQFGKISWVGNYKYETHTLNEVLNIKPGSIYNPALLQERLFANPMGRDLASLYMDNGYLFFYAEPVEVRIEGNVVDIEIRIQEGVQATINQVNIQGNNLTYDHVIRRELKTLPGDKFNRTQLQRSQRELIMLNIFDPAINILPIPNPADHTVDLNYIVEERPKFDVKLAGGWAGGSKFHLALTLGGNNFSLRKFLRGKRPLGDAQNINLKAAFQGKNHQDLSLQFMEPWFGGKKPTAFNFAINKSFQQTSGETFSNNLTADVPKNQSTPYPTKDGYLGSFGIKAGLGTRLKWPDDFFILRCGLAYSLYNYKNYILLQKDNYLNGRMHEISLNATIERNSINDSIYPTAGSEVGLHVKLTPPSSLFSQQKAYYQLPPQERYKWKEYHQWIGDMSYFYQLFGEWVVNIRAHGGIVGSYASKCGIGPFERFSMGGSGLLDTTLLGRELIMLRGYPDEYILPHDTQKGYKGGTIFDKFVVELRHPIIKSPFMYIYALAFAEAGNTWLHYHHWKPFDLKKSVGLGVRIHSPLLGTIGFDWGHGFDKTGEDKLEFNFSFGIKSR